MDNVGMQVASAASMLIWLAGPIALALVAGIVVRPRSPDAAGFMIAAGGVWLVGTVAGLGIPWLVTQVLSVHDYGAAFAWIRLVEALWHVVGWGLFLVGLVSLCRALPAASSRPPPAPWAGPVGGGGAGPA